jgi:hypothetical protein
MRWIAGLFFIMMAPPFALAAEPGWVLLPECEREFMVDAMRQKDEHVYLCEYRWVFKPTGFLQQAIGEKLAPTSRAKREAREKKTNYLNFNYEQKYLKREWWMAIRVIIALDRTNPQAAVLITEPNLGLLSQQLNTLLGTFPTEDQRKKRWANLAMELQDEEPTRYQPTILGAASDQVPGSLYGGLTRMLFPPIKDWYTRLGAPYVQAPHVVQSVWFWHEYIEQSDIKAYVEKTKAAFAEANAHYPSPLRILELKTPLD